jgi:uncharacterized protein
LTVAVAIVCKTPAAGSSKTRLSPPLSPEDCAEISGCFITDLARTIHLLTTECVAGCALYTPQGSEPALQQLLPAGFKLTLQGGGALGERLLQGAIDLLAQGHEGVILINSDSPTLPLSIVRDAVHAVRQGDCVVLSPAHDGGYTLIGLSKPHARLFEDIPWSTSTVYALTLARARDINIPVTTIPGWYDIDDAVSLEMLEHELAGQPLPFGQLTGAAATATRAFLNKRNAARARTVPESKHGTNKR